MTIFNGGPANGKVLNLKRSPLYLRVTQAGDRFDALDQLSDEPRQGETVFAYHRSCEPGMMHINAKGGAGGFFSFATYGYIAEQPSLAELMDTTLWREWCRHMEARK